MTTELGTYERTSAGLDIRFERRYPRAVDRVWAALTEPDRLADWLGVSHVEPWVGGRFDTIQDSPAPMTGQVRIWEPPAVLEITWNNKDAHDSIVRFELQADGPSATHLVFTQTRLNPGRSALMLPGWQWLFDRLANSLDGKPGTLSGKSWSDWQQMYLPVLKDVLPAEFDMRA